MSESTPELGDVGKTLGKRIGPLPVGGWIAAIIGGLGISWYLRGRGGNSAPEESEYEPGGTAATTPTSGLGGAAVSDPSLPGNIGQPTDPDVAGIPVIPITTNAQWRQQAVKYIVGANVSKPLNAERAVADFLAGRTLEQWEANVVNFAIAGIGPTPQAVPPIRVKSATPTTGGTSGTSGGKPKTNAAWGREAVKYLTSHAPKASLSFASNTVARYLAKQALGPNEVSAINRAVHGIGAPPNPLPIRRRPGIAHKVQPTADTHATRTADVAARRDTGTTTNPGA